MCLLVGADGVLPVIEDQQRAPGAKGRPGVRLAGIKQHGDRESARVGGADQRDLPAAAAGQRLAADSGGHRAGEGLSRRELGWRFRAWVPQQAGQGGERAP